MPFYKRTYSPGQLQLITTSTYREHREIADLPKRGLRQPAYSLHATSRGKYCDIAYGPKWTDVTRNFLASNCKISGSGGAKYCT